MDTITATTSMVKTDMNKNWIKNNPELAGKSLLQFFKDHPPEAWRLTIQRSHFPGMTLTLCAKRLEP